MWFNVDFLKLVVLLLPTFLRTPVMVSWVQALATPLRTLHYKFLQNRTANLYNLAHNGQVCYLRGALNDRFDATLRRIRIDDGNRHQHRYIYTDGEQKPQFLPFFIYDDSDYADTGVDFIVTIPAGLRYDDYEMRALIDFYKLATKRYKIQNNG